MNLGLLLGGWGVVQLCFTNFESILKFIVLDCFLNLPCNNCDQGHYRKPNSLNPYDYSSTLLR